MSIRVHLSRLPGKDFRRALRHWYARNRRDLPWRQTRDPYAILVSEFMLQQTQVATVLPYYNEWLRRFPDFGTVARASESDVLHAWQGLGYYARARNLHAAARLIQSKHDGRCPQTIGELRSLPGVGRYTANAVAAFAFDQSVPVVEANIARLLTRLFDMAVPIDSVAGLNALWTYAAQLVPTGSARVFNSALMDLGALICLPRMPKCHICPVKKFCLTTRPTVLPIKKARLQTKHLTERHVFTIKQGRILLQCSNNRWRGMWTLPGLSTPPQKRRAIHMSIFPFTNHQVRLQVFASRACRLSRSQRWFPMSALDSIPIPSPHRHAITALLSQRNSATN